MPQKKIFNRSNKSLRIENKTATSAEIVIYGGIGQDFWGDGSMISAKAFSDELKNLPNSVNDLTIRLNSPGGDVFDGITIYNRLKQLDMKKTVYIDGLAASIASIIALAGDEIYIGEGALYMVHLPWTFAFGDRQDFDNVINRLMDCEEQMLGIYAKASGLDKNEIRPLLEAETWMDADQAIEKGFVDSKVDESVPIAASAMKVPWFAKRPEHYNSETKAITGAKTDLKKKIQEKLARK